MEFLSTNMRYLCLLLAFLLVEFSRGAEEKTNPTPRVQPVVYDGKPLTDWIAEAKDTHRAGRYRAVVVLGNTGRDVKTAVPALIELLKDEDLWVRRFAASALGKFGPDAKIAVPALEELLGDKSAWVRQACAEALGRIGPEAKITIPALSSFYKEQNPWVRWTARDAVARIRPVADDS